MLNFASSTATFSFISEKMRVEMGLTCSTGLSCGSTVTAVTAPSSACVVRFEITNTAIADSVTAVSLRTVRVMIFGGSSNDELSGVTAKIVETLRKRKTKNARRSKPGVVRSPRVSKGYIRVQLPSLTVGLLTRYRFATRRA